MPKALGVVDFVVTLITNDEPYFIRCQVFS